MFVLHIPDPSGTLTLLGPYETPRRAQEWLRRWMPMTFAEYKWSVHPLVTPGRMREYLKQLPEESP